MVKPIATGIALAGAILVGAPTTASATATPGGVSPIALTGAIPANANVIITIGSDPGVCLPHSNCFTTDQGFYVNVYDTTASANQEDCVNLPKGFGNYISVGPFADTLTGPHPSAGIEMRTGTCTNGALIPADEIPEGVRSNFLQPDDASYQNQTNQTYSGDGSFYEVGLGACGMTNTDSQLVAALPAAQFDAATPAGNPNANPYCNKKMQVTTGGKSVVVTVVDRCAGCATGDVDLSPAAFDQLADPSVGRLPVTWDYI